MKILDLDLPDRVKRCLIRSRIDTLEKLLELRCDDLMKIRNLGRKSCTELMAFLEYNRLQLKDGRLYFLETREYHKRLLKEMEGKPVLGASYDEHEETPDPYEISQENEVLWRRVAWLEDKLCNKEKILFALKQYAEIGFDQLAWKNIVLLRVEEGEKDYETIKGWLDEN